MSKNFLLQSFLFIATVSFIGCSSNSSSKDNAGDESEDGGTSVNGGAGGDDQNSPVGGSGGNIPGEAQGGNGGDGDGPDEPIGGVDPGEPQGGNGGDGDGPDEPIGGVDPGEPQGGNGGDGDGPDEPIGGVDPGEPQGGNGGDGDGRVEVDPPIGDADEIAALGCGDMTVLTANDLTTEFDEATNLWVIEGIIPAGESQTSGACSTDNSNAEVVIPFKAPLTGTYSVLSLKPNENEFQSVYAIYTRTTCNDQNSEIECGLRNITPGSRSGLTFEAEADNVVLLFLDLEQADETDFTIQIIGAPNAAPVIDEESSFLRKSEFNGLNLKVAGSDINADVTRLHLFFFDTQDAPIGNLLTIQEFSFRNSYSPFGQIEFEIRENPFLNLMQGQEVGSVNIQLEDSQENLSPPIRLGLEDIPRAVENEPCDVQQFDNLCERGMICDEQQENTFTCKLIANIDRENSKAFNHEGHLHFVLTGEQREGNLQRFRYEFFNAVDAREALPGLNNNGDILPHQISFDQGNPENFKLAVRLPPIPAEPGQPRLGEIPEDASHVEINVDSSAAVTLVSGRIEIEDLPVFLENAACDIQLVKNICGENLSCINTPQDGENLIDPPLCLRIGENTNCPADWLPAMIQPPMEEGNPAMVTVNGDTAGNNNVAIGSCGGDLGDVVYSFTADVNATYEFNVDTSMDDRFWMPTLFMRRHCPAGEDTSELSCRRGMRSEIDLMANETIFIFVSGSSPEFEGENPQEGEFQLQVTRLAAP